MKGIINVYTRDGDSIFTVMTIYVNEKTQTVKGTLGEPNPFDFPIEPGMQIEEITERINLTKEYSTSLQKLLFT